VAPAVQAAVEPKTKRTNTAPFKVVPEPRELRDRIRAEAQAFGQAFDRTKPLTRQSLQKMAEELLQKMEQPEQYLGFTMVALSNEFWRDQVSAIDFKRRLLLLPHCLKNAEGCPADYDEFGLDCKKCGACNVADFKVKAEELGYKVLVSEGTPIVLKIIVSGHIDAIVGVACLNVLEKALDKVILAGIPCVAAPLLSSNCRSTSVDDDWVAQLIDLRTEPPKQTTKTFVHLMRAANQICEEPELSRLAPRSRKVATTNGTGHHLVNGHARAHDPLAEQEQIAYEWLGQGGKRSRPFITLAVYDALTGGAGTLAAERIQLPDPVRRVALAIESFHKASLVHDDIEDDDTFRYGRETLHRRYGVGTAINVGDYLIGLGYRLVSRERSALGAECAADILDKLAEAHLKLSEGQGAELLWRDAADKAITPLEALKIYALKTSPAFEAALYSGLRLAGPTIAYDKLVVEFSRHLGIAFQILNDFKDWDGDTDNKMIAGQDLLASRPTLLLALALEGLPPQPKTQLMEMLSHSDPLAAANRLGEARRLFDAADVFAKAEKLVDKYRARAEALADEVEPLALRELLYYLIDSVLDRQSPTAAPPVQMVQLTV
jgi:geranylgeranyl diphosphate synthase, type II